MKRIAIASALLAVIVALGASQASADPKPVTSAADGGAVGIRAKLSHGYLPTNSTTEVYATIDLRAQDLKAERRVPMNIALVIDRSLSMDGERIVQARRASKQLVQMLDEGDRIAIVSYGSDVTVESPSLPVTPANKETLLHTIHNIQVNGWTNLSGGYQKGLELAAAQAREDTINRVILLSDGHANRGITSAPALAQMARKGLERGVSLTTLGFGLDYNEDLMTRMAIEGAGNYHFVEEEKALAAIFASEVSGLSSTVARNARLTITLGEGVEMVALHGFSYRAKGNTVTVPLAEFFARQHKDLLLKLSVPSAAPGARPILDLRLAYHDIAQEKDVIGRAALRSVTTTDGALVEESVDADVVARVQQVDIANTMQEALTKYEAGQVEEAVTMLEEQRARTQAARDNYKIKDKRFERVDEEMEELADQIQQAPAASSAGKRLKKSKGARSLEIMKSDSAF